MKFIPPFLLLSFLFTFSLWSASPVPYSGKIDIRGVNYFGEAQFAFSLHDGNGTTHWRNGNQPKETIKVTIRNGRYSVLLGGQGMNSLPPELFLTHDKLYLKVEFDMEDGEGLRHLAPDQLITATPRALVAELAKVSELAKVAERVGIGAITRDMLSSEVLAKLDANVTASPSAPVTITRDMLPASVLNDLNKSVIITRDMLPQDVRDDLNKTVTITRDMLTQDVRDDMNATVGLNRLSPEISSALKPVILEQPVSVVSVEGLGTSLVVDAAGGNVTYQWKRDGANLTGATSRILTISDLNESQHDGNYSVIVSNAFGSTTSAVVGVDINGSVAKGLVGWWKFDETNGNTAYDSSGNGNDCNLSNGPTWIDGKINGALSFDGVNDYGGINLSDIFDPSSFTVSCWVFFQSTNSQMILNKGADVALNFRLYIDTSKNYVFDTFSPRLLHDKIGKVELSDWVFFTLHVNDLHQMFYKNGVVMQHGYRTSNVFKDSSLLQIGAKLSPIDKFGDFIIDDLRIYDRSLSAFEVKSLYELGEKQDSNASAGTPLVQAEVADGSVTASKIASKTIGKDQISDDILKYLKPEITSQPQAQTVYADTNATFSVTAEGKYLTYQWKKDGSNVTGETSSTLSITDANATQHDGNYSVVVSNDFGSVESDLTEVMVKDAILNGLVGWWKFDEGSGTVAYDSSGNGNDGNLTNGPTWATGKIGGALSFDGVNDYVDFGQKNLGVNSNLSVSYWFKPNNGNGVIVEQGWNFTNNEFGWVVYLGANDYAPAARSISFGSGDTSGNYNSKAIVQDAADTVDLNVWQHVSVIKVGTNIKIYLVGSLSHEGQIQKSAITYNSGYSLSIGKDLTDTSSNYNSLYQGLIDDMRIYDRALSATEVQALYNLGQ